MLRWRRGTEPSVLSGQFYCELKITLKKIVSENKSNRTSRYKVKSKSPTTHTLTSWSCFPEGHKVNKGLCTFLEHLFICKIKTRYDGPSISFSPSFFLINESTQFLLGTGLNYHPPTSLTIR